MFKYYYFGVYTNFSTLLLIVTDKSDAFPRNVAAEDIVAATQVDSLNGSPDK